MALTSFLQRWPSSRLQPSNEHTSCSTRSSHTLLSIYFVFSQTSTNLSIEGSMVHLLFVEATKQSPPTIQWAYITLHITGSSHTLLSIYFVFSKTSTNLSIGGSMTHSNYFCPWPDLHKHGRSQHRRINPCHTGLPARLTYNLSMLPSQVPHLGWGE